ncbi:MAG: M24 family metallopeptidase [Halobacteriales archaeon]
MDADALDAYLGREGYDGYLIDADSEDADQRYLSGYDAPDPFITLYTPDALWVLVSSLEYARAKSDSNADVVRRFADYDFQAMREEHGKDEARRRMVAAFLGEAGVNAVATPKRFPLETADGLRAREVAVDPDAEDTITTIRATKTDAEIDHVRATQRANETALGAAEELLSNATIEDGRLHHEGEALTAERVKEEIEVTLLREGCALEETIVAGGRQGADPHERGHGPLPANEPIVIDVFPRNTETKYHADMTRTFVIGEASEEVRRRHELTIEAMEAAIEAVEPGTTGAAIHDAVCDVYEAADYQTLRSNPEADTGFIHSTGHGVGLDVHEQPSVAPGGEELEPGHVITIEPGLYDPEVGGMRVEDLVVVTEDGCENLTTYHTDLTPGRDSVNCHDVRKK